MVAGVRQVVGVFRGVRDGHGRVPVDEWLRFRSGESRLSLATKAAIGLLWFFVSYVMRFAINVLIEPQINPIKHFPVVTVSHKLLLPLIPQFAGVLELTLEKPLAWTMAGTIVTGIPGVFGFLVWELKENWRLCAANHNGTCLRCWSALQRDDGPLARQASSRHAAKREAPP